MDKKIFKAGNYFSKGKYSIEQLKSWVASGKEFSIILGHVGDWLGAGYPRTAIPFGGKVKCKSVDSDGFLIGEIKYNDFGKKIVESGAYDNFSLGITQGGQPDHLALLGYAPPHIKDLDKAFSEFTECLTEEEITYFEFNKEGKMTFEEIKNLLSATEITEENSGAIGEISAMLAEKSGMVLMAKEPTEEQVAEFAKGLGKELVEIKVPVQKTEEELRTEIAHEFSVKQEKEEMKKQALSMVPPSLKSLVEFSIEEAYKGDNYNTVFEFSADEKVVPKELLKTVFSNGGPFAHLKKTHTAGKEFSEPGNAEISALEKAYNEAKSRQSK